MERFQGRREHLELGELFTPHSDWAPVEGLRTSWISLKLRIVETKICNIHGEFHPARYLIPFVAQKCRIVQLFSAVDFMLVTEPSAPVVFISPTDDQEVANRANHFKKFICLPHPALRRGAVFDVSRDDGDVSPEKISKETLPIGHQQLDRVEFQPSLDIPLYEAHRGAESLEIRSKRFCSAEIRFVIDKWSR